MTSNRIHRLIVVDKGEVVVIITSLCRRCAHLRAERDIAQSSRS